MRTARKLPVRTLPVRKLPVRMLAAAAALALTLALTAGAGAAPNGPTADQCRAVDDHLVTPGYGADVLTRDAEAHCRSAGACPSDEEAVAAHGRSWAHGALRFQERLSQDLPLVNA